MALAHAGSKTLHKYVGSAQYWSLLVVLHSILPLQTWSGKQENWDAAQKILVALAKANSEAQLGQFKGPHPVPGERQAALLDLHALMMPSACLIVQRVTLRLVLLRRSAVLH